ncbi:MAG: hypothetical protein U5L76_05765 [Patescibacteria group bacterium]|nr:hypothetical protein [Patescibacteria group bacterium]MDZ7799073.1 hypothetical protein [Patescibacteria group bacterium]
MLFNLKNKKVKYTLTSLSLVFILVSFGIFWPQAANAGAVELFTELLGHLLYEVAGLLGKILVAVIQMLIAIVQYNDFGQATAVQKGWVIIRDVCNMFFVAVLLMIAFGTIFKWETYRYNKLLGRFILMAFLINFSKFIALFLIDVSQVIMMTFVNAFSDIAAGNLISAFGLEEMFKFMESGGQDLEFSGVIGALLLAIILLTIAVVTVLVLTMVLLMRILVLWLLIVLSPLAYFLRTWPGSGEKASSMWWKEFGKNLINGPLIAFFLWLSLSIISTSGGDKLAQEELNYGDRKITTEQAIEYEEDTGMQDLGASVGGKFYTTISNISSSDRLLSFIISISLLMGSLLVAQKMSSAGGQAAGTVLGKVKTGLTKAAKLGAAGVTFGAGRTGLGLLARTKPVKRAAKGVGKWALGETMARTGFELRPSEWGKGIERGGERKLQEREDRMRAKSQKRREKGYHLAASLSNPEHAFYEYWRLSTPGKMLRHPLQFFGKGTKKMHDASLEQKAKLDKIKERDSEVYDDEKGEYKDVTKIQEEKMIEKEKEKVIKEKTEEVAQKREDLKPEKSWPELEKELKADGATENDLAEFKKDFQTVNEEWMRYASVGEVIKNEKGKKIGTQRITFDEKWEKMRTRLEKKGLTDEEIKEEEKKFNKEWNRNKAENMLNPHELNKEARKKFEDKNYSDGDLRKAYFNNKEEEIEKLKKEKNEIKDPDFIMEEDQKQREKKLQAINDELKKIDRDIKAKEEEGKKKNIKIDLSKEKNLKKDLEKRKEEIEKAPLSDKEKERKENKINEINEKIENKEFEKDFTDMTEIDRRELLRQREAQKKEYEKARKKEIDRMPAIDYSTRKNQRLAIQKEKNELTTDSWQEIASFIEDAKKKNNLTRVAAGYLKAAEYGNENEIQNYYGYDSDAKGLKQFVMGELVGEKGLGKNFREETEKAGLSWESYIDKFGHYVEGMKGKKGMGMSMEQALSIANDVSYTAERMNHWGAARAVGVQDGRQVWQKEKDRLTEVMAEVRKLDFENTMRRFNRLAFGSERIKDKWDFRGGGGRDFMMNDFALAFMMENWKKFPTLLERGRFGVNLAINLSKENNIDLLQELSTEIPAEERDRYLKVVDGIQNFAATGGESEFDDLERMHQRNLGGWENY